jgi:hypothetical protein
MKRVLVSVALVLPIVWSAPVSAEVKGYALV